MNTYSKLLFASITEIDRFSASGAGSQFDIDWYKDIKETIIKAAEASEDRQAEDIMELIGRSIVDSGPLTSSFAPSLDAARDAAYRKRNRKNRNSKNQKTP